MDANDSTSGSVTAGTPTPVTSLTSIDVPQAGFLHVVFHGLFCFFELKDYILCRAPKVMSGGLSEHVYLAGNWLGELTVAPGQYSLNGVRQGYAKFPRDRNLTIRGARPAPNPSPDLFAEFHMPYPERISSIETVDINNPSDILEGNDLARVEAPKIAALQVFTYSFPNHLKLQLSDHPWSAAETMVGGFCALHLFAESDRPLEATGQHVTNSFEIAMRMFDSIDLRLKPNPPKIQPAQMVDIPFGARLEEMEDLFSRLQRMAKLGVMLKRGDNLNELWDESSLYGGDLERCGGAIGV